MYKNTLKCDVEFTIYDLKRLVHEGLWDIVSHAISLTLHIILKTLLHTYFTWSDMIQALHI